MVHLAFLNVVLNIYDFHQNAFEAAKVPRIHHQLISNKVQFESRHSSQALSKLTQKEHLLKHDVNQKRGGNCPNAFFP